MKHNHNHDNAPGAGPQLQPVQFEFTHPSATAVSVAGTFNDWQPGIKAMHPSGNGRWRMETTLAPGTYEYCFVIDGRWLPDPQARASVPNPFGGLNSILTVAGSLEPAHLTVAARWPLKNAGAAKVKTV